MPLNRKFVVDPQDHSAFASTSMGAVAAHVAYIRHLSRPSGLIPVLIKAHGFSEADATSLAETIVPYIEQGLHFHCAASHVPHRIRPVLRYYSYLNLAKAVVLIYEPEDGQKGTGSHGASDKTRDLSNLELKSKVLSIGKGVIPMFHNLLTHKPLPKEVTLDQLLLAIPALGAEMARFYGISTNWLRVQPQLIINSDKWVSQFAIRLFDHRFGNSDERQLPLPEENVQGLFDSAAYEPTRDQDTATWSSRQSWMRSDALESTSAHQEAARRLSNIGGHLLGSAGVVHYVWRYSPGIDILPTLSAQLMLSYVLSSLCRYRAALLDKLDTSEISIVLEVFEGESDATMLPGLRHLFYGAPLFLSASQFT